jgi:hypothetical protein
MKKGRPDSIFVTVQGHDADDLTEGLIDGDRLPTISIQEWL